MKTIRALAAALVLSAAAAAAGAQQLVVIGHPALKLSGGDIGDVYLGEKQLAGAVKLVPVDNSALQDTFLSSFLSIDAAKYRSAWAKKSFREGLMAPAVKGSDAEVVDFVKKTVGAVGYIKGPAPAGVAVITQK